MIFPGIILYFGNTVPYNYCVDCDDKTLSVMCVQKHRKIINLPNPCNNLIIRVRRVDETDWLPNNPTRVAIHSVRCGVESEKERNPF